MDKDNTCKDFLKNPTEKAFKIKILDLKKIKNSVKRKGYEFILLEARTTKQEGDIAGSKLLKFHRHHGKEIERAFRVQARGFEYQGKKSARYFFVAKRKKEILVSGPEIKDKKNVVRFRRKHKKGYVKNGRLYTKESSKLTLKKFIENWKKKHRKKIKEMAISSLRIID